MLAVELLSVDEVAMVVAQRCKAARLSQKLTQRGLALRSGVSLGSLKRFEHTGSCSLQTLLKLAFALNMISTFETLFEAPEFASLDEVLSTPSERKRGTRT